MFAALMGSRLRAVMDRPKIFLVGDERVLKGLAEKRLAR